MARRAVQTLVAEFVKAGGDVSRRRPWRRRRCRSPATRSCDGIRTSAGETLRAERYVFACGPWLPKVFPELLGSRIFPTRQEVFFFAPAAGRHALLARPAADVGGLQQRRHLLRHAGSRSARLQDRARQARAGHRSGQRRSQAERRAARRRARVHAGALPGARGSADGRVARVPVREQLERRPAHRSASRRWRTCGSSAPAPVTASSTRPRSAATRRSSSPAR